MEKFKIGDLVYYIFSDKEKLKYEIVADKKTPYFDNFPVKGKDFLIKAIPLPNDTDRYVILSVKESEIQSID